MFIGDMRFLVHHPRLRGGGRDGPRSPGRRGDAAPAQGDHRGGHRLGCCLDGGEGDAALFLDAPRITYTIRIRVSISDTPIYLCAFNFCRNLTYPRIRILPIPIRVSVSVLEMN